MTEALSPRERRQKRTSQAILDAARKIINTKGVDALSMRAIADAIDYSPAGLYEYFGSKEEIVLAVVAEGFQRFTQALKAVDTTLPTEEYLVALGLAYVNFAVKNSDYFLLMFTTAPLVALRFKTGDTLTKNDLLNDDSSFGVLLRAVQRSLDEDVMQLPNDAGLLDLAYAIWTQVHGMAMLRISGIPSPLPVDYEKADRLALRALHRGFGLN